MGYYKNKWIDELNARQDDEPITQRLNTYYIIIQDTCEVFELGQYDSRLRAEKDTEAIEHLSHGYSYIIIEESCLHMLSARLQPLLK